MREVGIAEQSKPIHNDAEMDLNKPIYHVSEVATILGIHASTVTKFLKSNALTGVRVNDRYIWVVGASLRRFLEGGAQCSN